MKNPTILIILSLLLSQTSFSLNITWTGSTSNSWSDSSNFSPMVVPNLWDTVTIDTTANHPILSGNTRVYKLIMNGDTLDLNGYQMQTGNEGEFRGGVIINGTLKCSGTLAYFSGTIIDAEVIATCEGIQISESVFHQKTYFENTGAVSSVSQGGNVFHDVATLKNSSSDEDLIMAYSYGDVFHDSLYVIINSAKNIMLAHTDTSTMKGCVRFQSTNYGSISLGKGGGVSIMEDNGHMAVESGDFYFGQLMLMNIQQTNTTGHRMILTTSGMPDTHPILILTGNYFKGETDFESPHILLKNNSFEANTMLTKSGGNSDLSEGNNHFLATATITNSSTTGYFNLGGNRSDFYHGNVTFSSGTKPLIAGYKSYCYFYKNVEVNSSSVGISYAVWAGDTLQQMSGTHTQTYGRLLIDKPSDKVVAATPIDITSSVTFTSGHLETDTTNIITFLAGSGAIDASNNSFVSGPVKKVGNTAFDFPVGKGGYYRPLGISAPDSVTETFVGEYFDVGQTFGNLLDSTIYDLTQCDYWSLDRKTGVSELQVSLSFNENECNLVDTSDATVVRWNGNQWDNLGRGFSSSDNELSIIGAVNTDTVLGFFSIGYLSGGGSPVNAFQLHPEHYCTDSLYQITKRDIWFHFENDSSSLTIGAINQFLDNYHPYITSIKLFNGTPQTGLTLLKEVQNDSSAVDTLKLNIDGLQLNQNQNYYIQLVSNNNCDSCITDTLSFKLCLLLQIDQLNLFRSFENICGLRIATAAAQMNQRMSPASNPSLGLNPTFINLDVISNTGTPEIMEAYLYGVAVGDVNMLGSIQGIFDNGVPNNITMNRIAMLPNATCWGVDGFSDFTATYRADITNLILQGSNTYFVELPFLLPPGSPFFSEQDWNGVAIIVIFRDCSEESQPGWFYLYDGLDMFTGGALQLNLQITQNVPFAQTPTNTYSNALGFMGIGDVEEPNATRYRIQEGPSVPINSSHTVVQNDFWNISFANNVIANNTGFNSVAFDVFRPDNTTQDCISVPFAGLMYNEGGNVSCSNIVELEISSINSCAGVELCANVNPPGNYNFQWSTSETTPCIIVNSTGTYTVTVTGSNICTVTDDVIVGSVSGSPMTVSLVVQNDCQSLCNGAIDVSVADGTAPYTYIWSNGSSLEDLTNLCAGTYTVTVTDANGCSATESATVLEDNTSFEILGTSVNCEGDEQQPGILHFKLFPIIPAMQVGIAGM